jgi:topoisomerase-4 subunit A
MNLGEGARAAVCTPVAGESVAVIGENRKLLIFGLDEMPEMGRGRGVIMQKYNRSGLSDAVVFKLSQGLVCHTPDGRTRTFEGLKDWVGKRAQAGRLPPTGVPRSNRFS